MSERDDIPKRLREQSVGDYSVSLWDDAANEIDRLRADLAQRTAERDEARRMACVSEARYQEERSCPLDIPREEWIHRDARIIAAERGWDCFKEEVKP